MDKIIIDPLNKMDKIMIDPLNITETDRFFAELEAEEIEF